MSMVYSRISLTECIGCSLLVILMGLASLAMADEVEINDDQRFTLLTAPLDDEEGRRPDFSDRARVILARFAELWSDEAYGDELHEVSDENLSLRLRAAETTLLSGLEPWVLERFHSVIEVAQVRGLGRPAHIRRLFDAYQGGEKPGHT